MPGPYTPRPAASITACPPPPRAASSRRPSSPASAWRWSAGRAAGPVAHPPDRARLRPDRRRRRRLLLRHALGSVAGSIGGGLLTERIGRRVVLTAAVLLLALGLALIATVPTWTLFLVAALPFGHRPGRHRWRDERARPRPLPGRARPGAQPPPPVLQPRRAGLATRRRARRRCRRRRGRRSSSRSAVAAVPLAILFAAVRLPSGRHEHAPGASAVRTGLALPLVLLAVAIACYVGSEIGVSNWLVPLPRGGVADPRDLGARVVLGMPRARAPRQRAPGRPVRPCPVRGGLCDRRVGRPRRRGRGALARGLDRPVRRRRLRVRTGLPADHGRRGRPLPGSVGGGQRLPVGRRGHRRDHLSAGHGLRVGRGRPRGGDDRRGGRWSSCAGSSSWRSRGGR